MKKIHFKNLEFITPSSKNKSPLNIQQHKDWSGRARFIRWNQERMAAFTWIHLLNLLHMNGLHCLLHTTHWDHLQCRKCDFSIFYPPPGLRSSQKKRVKFNPNCQWSWLSYCFQKIENFFFDLFPHFLFCILYFSIFRCTVFCICSCGVWNNGAINTHYSLEHQKLTNHVTWVSNPHIPVHLASYYTSDLPVSRGFAFKEAVTPAYT